METSEYMQLRSRKKKSIFGHNKRHTSIQHVMPNMNTDYANTGRSLLIIRTKSTIDASSRTAQKQKSTIFLKFTLNAKTDTIEQFNHLNLQPS